jgi:hypothetical protein
MKAPVGITPAKSAWRLKSRALPLRCGPRSLSESFTAAYGLSYLLAFESRPFFRVSAPCAIIRSQVG